MFFLPVREPSLDMPAATDNPGRIYHRIEQLIEDEEGYELEREFGKRGEHLYRGPSFNAYFNSRKVLIHPKNIDEEELEETETRVKEILEDLEGA